MAVTVLQNAQLGSTVSSGGTVTLPGGVTAGSTVLFGCHSFNNTLASLSGLGATWSSVSATTNGTNQNYQIWKGVGCTTGTTITITTNGGATAFENFFIEVAGAGTVSTGGVATGSSNAPAITFTGLVTGELLWAYSSGAGAYISEPWTHVSDGGSQSLAYEITSGSSNQTATWSTGASGSWAVAGAIVAPSGAAPAGKGAFFALF